VPLTSEVAQYMQKLVEIFEQYAKMSHHLAFEGVMSTLKLDDPDKFADTLASHLLITTAEKQQLLETPSPYERLQKLQDFLEIEIEKINIDKRINSKVKKQMERAQKEYYLNEKIKAIHHELGRKDDRSDEIEELRQKIEEAGMPKDTKEKAIQELKRLGRSDGLAQLHRVARLRSLEEGIEGNQRHRAGRADPQRGSLRARKDQRPHPRVPGGAPASESAARLDPLLRRTSGCRQDIAREVDRPRHRPQVRSPLPGRRPR
jgi:type I site-specific restriction-modification system R (restriction) subunit